MSGKKIGSTEEEAARSMARVYDTASQVLSKVDPAAAKRLEKKRDAELEEADKLAGNGGTTGERSRARGLQSSLIDGREIGLKGPGLSF